MSGSIENPRAPFWMVVTDGNLDGSLDTMFEPTFCATKKQAMGLATDDALGCGGACYVFEVRPVAHVESVAQVKCLSRSRKKSVTS